MDTTSAQTFVIRFISGVFAAHRESYAEGLGLGFAARSNALFKRKRLNALSGPGEARNSLNVTVTAVNESGCEV